MMRTRSRSEKEKQTMPHSGMVMVSSSGATGGPPVGHHMHTAQWVGSTSSGLVHGDHHLDDRLGSSVEYHPHHSNPMPPPLPPQQEFVHPSGELPLINTQL